MKVRILLTICLFTLMKLTALAGREDKDTLVVIKTRFGEITVLLFRDTPVHRANFLRLAANGSYDSTTFHRIIRDFILQGGDPNSKDADPSNDGLGTYGQTLPAEFDTAFTHIQGALAAARTSNPEKRSSDCQFYLVENPNGTHFLDRNYTVFGQTLRGIEVIQSIASQPKGTANRPDDNIRMWMKILPMKKEKITETYGWDYASRRIRPELIKNK